MGLRFCQQGEMEELAKMGDSETLALYVSSWPTSDTFTSRRHSFLLSGCQFNMCAVRWLMKITGANFKVIFKNK